MTCVLLDAYFAQRGTLPATIYAHDEVVLSIAATASAEPTGRGRDRRRAAARMESLLFAYWGGSKRPPP